jgi:DNA-binding transcriptional MerR regulator
MTAAALRKFLTSADVAKALGVPKTNLFLWEDKGKIPKARRDSMSGYRIYTREDVEKIRKIINKVK